MCGLEMRYLRCAEGVCGGSSKCLRNLSGIGRLAFSSPSPSGGAQREVRATVVTADSEVLSARQQLCYWNEDPRTDMQVVATFPT